MVLDETRGVADAIRKALSMGADSAVHVCDDALAGSDSVRAPRSRWQWPRRSSGSGTYDLVIAGSESSDSADLGGPGDAGRAPQARAQLTFVNKIDVDGSAVSVQRLTDDGYQVVEGEPARGGVGGREDQRAALPLVQGDHGGQEEAGGCGLRRRSGAWRRADVGAGRVVDRRGRRAPSRPARSAGTIVEDGSNGADWRWSTSWPASSLRFAEARFV